jgi:toxin ParE1/3/4
MPIVRFTGPAIHDLSEIGAHIAKDNERISRDFVARLREKCYAISATPYIGRQRDDFGADIRSFPFGNYIIFYRPISSGIAVIHVLHGARDLEAVFHSERE